MNCRFDVMKLLLKEMLRAWLCGIMEWGNEVEATGTFAA